MLRTRLLSRLRGQKRPFSYIPREFIAIVGGIALMIGLILTELILGREQTCPIGAYWLICQLQESVFMDTAETFGFLVAIILFVLETPDRQIQAIHEAYKTIDAAKGIETSYARKEALQQLNHMGQALEGLDANGADLNGIELENAVLTEASLNGAMLNNANLQGSQLNKAQLKEATLQRTNLQEANLRGTNLQGANLQGAKLQGANLQEANLKGAKLQGANLEGAKLQGANFEGADLTDTVLKHTVRHGVIGLDPQIAQDLDDAEHHPRNRRLTRSSRPGRTLQKKFQWLLNSRLPKQIRRFLLKKEPKWPGNRNLRHY